MKDISAVTFAVQSFVTLFVIMDPPGATPIFLGLVADKSPRVRRILAIQLSKYLYGSTTGCRSTIAIASCARAFDWKF